MKTFESFVNEDYFAGLSKSTVDKKKAQMKKQADMPDDDPDAYKELPGDTKGLKNLKTSRHTNKYHDMFGDDNVDEAEQKQSTDKSPIGGAIETGLENKSDDTGVPIGILRAVMRRGLAAWKTGHRPGANQQQWGYARVNSFLTKGKGTWGKADADLAKEVRDGGHDKELKESSVCEYEILMEKEGLNEGHDGIIGKAPGSTRDEATKKLQSQIDMSKDDGGDLKKFRGVKYVGSTTKDGLDRLAMRHEDEYIVLGEVDGELTYAYSRRS